MFTSAITDLIDDCSDWPVVVMATTTSGSSLSVSLHDLFVHSTDISVCLSLSLFIFVCISLFVYFYVFLTHHLQMILPNLYMEEKVIGAHHRLTHI